MFKKSIITFFMVFISHDIFCQSIRPENELSVFEPGEVINFKIDSAKNKYTALSYEVKDYFDNVHKAERVSAGDGIDISLPALPNGYYELNVSYENNDGKIVEKLQQPFGVIPQPDRSISKHDNQFGAMVIPHTGYPTKDKERDAQFMNRIGMRWIRTHRFNWLHVQRKADSPYDWRDTDAEIDIYNKYGLGVVATTCWPTPAWASSGANKNVTNHMKKIMAPSDEYMPKLEEFCKAMATRYKGKIDYYEIGNEVDAGDFWQGKAKNSIKADSRAIMKDYCELFLKTSRALKSGDPEAKTAPNTTGLAPDGHTYKNWLQVMYDMGIAKEMNLFSTHYLADVDGIHEVMKKNDKVLDIIFTEIGGFVRTEKDHDSKPNYEKMIKTTYVHYGTVLNKGGKALCKFLFRDIPAIKNPPWVAGMLRKDFKIRPEYVAYGTLIRMLAGATPVKELNITTDSDNGWMQGFSFTKEGKTINLVWLQDALTANVSVKSTDGKVKIVDVMGRESEAVVENGTLNLNMKKMYPLFIVGDITDKPGPVEHPKPKIVKTVNLTIENSDFEGESDPNFIPNWNLLINEKDGSGSPIETFTAIIDKEITNSGKQSLRLEATKQTDWYGVSTKLPVDQIPKPKVGQYVEFIISYDLKGENVEGIGSGVTLAFRNENMARIDFKCGNWTKGTFDWQRKEYKPAHFDVFHKDTEYVTLEMYLGKATGKVWIDNVEVKVNLWERCGAESRIVN